MKKYDPTKYLKETDDYIEYLGFADELKGTVDPQAYKHLEVMLKQQDKLIGDSREEWSSVWQDEQDAQDSFEDFIKAEEKLVKQLQGVKSREAIATLSNAKNIMTLWKNMTTKRFSVYDKDGKEK